MHSRDNRWYLSLTAQQTARDNEAQEKQSSDYASDKFNRAQIGPSVRLDHDDSE
jgi:hypothetical protein